MDGIVQRFIRLVPALVLGCFGHGPIWAQPSTAALSDAQLADSIALTLPCMKRAGNDSLSRHCRLRWMALTREHGRRASLLSRQQRLAPLERLEMLKGQIPDEALADSVIGFLDTVAFEDLRLSALSLLARTRAPAAYRFFARHIDWLYFTGYEDQPICLGYLIKCPDRAALTGYVFDSLRDDPHTDDDFWLFYGALVTVFSDNSEKMRPLIATYAERAGPDSITGRFCRFVETELDR